MKKGNTTYYILAFFIIITSVLFCINLLLEENNKNIKHQEENKEKEEKNIIEYKANESIRVRMHESGQIVAMDINDYLRGVLPAEMSPKYNIEALKAQAIVARTYTYKKMSASGEGNDADICDDFGHCQAFYNKDTIYQIWRNKGFSEDEILAYWDKINEAVVSTQNKVICYNGELINAFFHASSPQKTENVDQIWNGVSYPYLLSVDSTEDENYENRTSEVKVSFDDFETKINENRILSENISDSDLSSIEICDYTTSGRVKNIKVGQQKISAEKLRTIIGLKSTNFTLEINDNTIVFHVIGYGHGVGMSQVRCKYLCKCWHEL